MKWSKWWTAGLIVVLILGGGGGYWWWSGQQKQQPLQAAVQTTAVRKGNLESTISGSGNIEAAYRETLRASSTGKIAAVKVEEGASVKKGEIVATFEQDDEEESISDQISSKQLNLKKQQLDLANLQKQFKEAADDDQRADLGISIQKQQLDIASTEDDIASLQEEEEDALEPITAPIDGTLASLSLAVGDTVGGQSNSSNSATLGEVVDYDHLQIAVGVDELDISKVELGQSATVLVEALPDQTFTGKVTEIAREGTATGGVATFDVTVMLDEAAGLKVGMSAEATVIVAQKADALYLPIEAVQSFGNQYFVMVPSAEAAGESSGAPATGNRNPAGNGQRLAGTDTPATGSSAPGGSGSASGDSAATNGRTAGNGNRNGNGNGNGNANRQNRMAAAEAQSGVKRVSVEVGIHNEDFIEIVTGLQEGEAVIVPTVAASNNSNQNRFGGAGFGAGGFPGGGQVFAGGGGERVVVRGGQGGGNR